jgi:hypothetical protein
MKALLLAMLVATAAPTKGPVIVHQQSNMVMHVDASPTWERHIVVKNPVSRPIWFWIECESRLTSNAIGQPGNHTSEYVFPDIPPGEQCSIHHWQVQDGRRPPIWSP